MHGIMYRAGNIPQFSSVHQHKISDTSWNLYCDALF